MERLRTVETYKKWNILTKNNKYDLFSECLWNIKTINIEIETLTNNFFWQLDSKLFIPKQQIIQTNIYTVFNVSHTNMGLHDD